MRSPPPLSLSQRAYMFQREKFLAGIASRAARLAQDGYSVEVGACCHEFLVTPPHRRIPYVVNALHQTCTCCFYRRQVEGEPLTSDASIVPCKHWQGLRALLHAERLQLEAQGRWCCVYRLRAHWLMTLAARWQQDQQDQEEQQGREDRPPSPTPDGRCRHCAAPRELGDRQADVNNPSDVKWKGNGR